MRNRFDRQLERLNSELITMGAMCEEAIQKATAIFVEDKVDTNAWAAEVSAKEVEINRKEREIESMCMDLLLSQQPVAKDLRVVSSALKMISDMERIGDQALDIAEIVTYIKEDAKKVQGKVHITEMVKAATKMVTDSVNSFVNKDLVLAQEVSAYDDIVDDLFEKVKNELITAVAQDKDKSEIYIDLLMIAKYLERIGDHAVNITEWVQYSLTGKHVTDEVLDKEEI